MGARGNSDFHSSGVGDHYVNLSGRLNPKYKLAAAFTFILLGAVAVPMCFLIDVFYGNIYGLNACNLGMFFLGLTFLILGMVNSARTQAAYSIRRGKLPERMMRVWSGTSSLRAVGDNDTWAETDRRRYQISYADRDLGPENAEKTYEALRHTPGILWWNPIVWMSLYIVSVVIHFVLRMIVIPYLTVIDRSDVPFRTVDVLSFYLPSVLTLIFGLICILIPFFRDGVLHKVALTIASENTLAEEERERAREVSESMNSISEKWFYDICPYCGTEAISYNTACTKCGSSLEVKVGDSDDIRTYHRLGRKDL